MAVQTAKNLYPEFGDETESIAPRPELRRLKVAICGTRGIPACYGGFETFAEELSTRLVQAGHDVTVYGRRHLINFALPTYQGTKIRLLPAPRSKYLETPIHTLLSLIDVVFRRFDIVLVCNAANSPLLFLPRLFGIPAVVNVDGVERKRRKWNLLGRLWYRLGEVCSVLFANKIIADAKVIESYYRNRYRQKSAVIPYGCCRSEDLRVRSKVEGLPVHYPDPKEHELFKELGVAPGQYILYVSRLEPENNAHVVIEAFNRLPEKLRRLKLVIVGDAPYARDYIAKLKNMASEHVVFAGYRFNSSYRALQLGARLYVQATEVGGTHPALVEAMGFGNCVVANDTPENREVVGDAGVFYRKNDSNALRITLARLMQDYPQVLDYRREALARARECYDWDQVARSYEELFYSVTKVSPQHSSPVQLAESNPSKRVRRAG